MHLIRLTAASILLIAPFRTLAQATTRVENASFSATVTSFDTSAGANGLRFVTATIHVQNKTKAPLTLACDASKIVANDDQGNRYGGAVIRGVGLINGSNVDPKFVLPAGGGGDMHIEMRARLASNVVRGVTFDLSLVLRDVSPLAGGQLKLGAERMVQFAGLRNGFGGGDPIGDRVVDAGPFTAQITRSVTGAAGRWKTLDLTLRLKNTSDKPLILAYESTSSYGIDDQGIRFGYGVAGTHDTSFSGIGLATGRNADPQFTLAPGESKDVRFTVMRPNSREVAGTKLTYYVALQQLEVLPSDQIRTVRQFSLTFPGVALTK
ncbi:hypothetical protein EON82_01045 [bacterium]|nr:MAG: hypothetical protein EON82_01045 [bacterium]